jgi:hypothetical protein
MYVLLDQRKENIPVWSVWYHWKNNKVTYCIVDLVIIEATDTVGVVYEQLVSWIHFLRPAKEFLEQITQENYSWPRFIGDTGTII